MRRSRSAFALACVSFASLTASCAAIFGFERLSEETPSDASTTEAGDAAPDQRDAGDPACLDIGIPESPADASPTTIAPVLGALRTLDFGVDVDGGRPTAPGFNLDRVCSVDLASSSCTSSLLPTTFETHAKDKSAAGIDNAGFSLFEYISRFSDVLSAKRINEGISKGLYGAVIRVTGWNGSPDDDSVEVEIFPAIGVVPRDGGAPALDDGDEWLLDSTYRVGGVLEASAIRSDRAWVTGGRAVARFKRAVFLVQLVDDPKMFEVRISDAVMAATLGLDSRGKLALIDGVVAGRWKTTDFLDQVRSIHVDNGSGLVNTTLCDPIPQAAIIYKSVKDTICDARDIRSDSQDNTQLPCDAVSVAARIEAYNINSLGQFRAPFDAGVRCAAPGSIPANDDCP